MNFKVLDIELSNNINLGFTISGQIETHLKVAHINPLGLASKAGLKKDDYILTINGAKIKNRDDIINSVQCSENKVSIKVMRYNNLEMEDISRINNKNPKLVRWASTNTQSLHYDLLSNIGSKIGMEISRSHVPLNKSLENRNSALMRRCRTLNNFQSLNCDFLTSLRATNGINVSRSNTAKIGSRETIDNSAASKPESRSIKNRLKYFENNISTSTEDLTRRRYSIVPPRSDALKPMNRLSYVGFDSTSSSSIHDVENRPSTPIEIKCRRQAPPNKPSVLPNSFSAADLTPLSPFIAPRNIRDRLTNDNDATAADAADKYTFLARNFSLRINCSKSNDLFQNQSLVNISNVDKPIESSSLPMRKCSAMSRKLSMVKSGSMISLFEEELTNSMIVDYKLDWRNIYGKISKSINNGIEIELINYFHNNNLDLKIFPINCLHRFITFDDVLEIVFNNILPAELQVDFQEEILKQPTQLIDIDYDLNSYDVTKLIRCNVRKLEHLSVEYDERRAVLDEKLELFKEALDKFLIKPDSSEKMHRDLHTICTKFQLLSDVLILMITSMSIWKLLKEFPYLCQRKTYEHATLTTCENIFCELRDSQIKLEQQIVKLFKQFRDDNCDEVLKLLDQIFSENLELSICLPIFEDKLTKDNQMLTFLESLLKTVAREEQFV